MGLGRRVGSAGVPFEAARRRIAEVALLDAGAVERAALAEQAVHRAAAGSGGRSSAGGARGGSSRGSARSAGAPSARARVVRVLPEASLGLGREGVLGDRADARHQGVGREPGAGPEQVELRVPEGREAAEERARSSRRSRRRRGAPRASRAARAAVRAQAARANLQPRAPREIAPHLAAQARGRDREGRTSAEVRILRRRRSSRGAGGGRGGRRAGRSTPGRRTASSRRSR